MTHTLHLGDCRTVLATLDDASIDSIVCDPPYELGFMGKAWDNSGIAYDVTVWQQCYRVLKPGGHLVAFSGSRTYHRLAVAIEDAGFEIRDQIQWIYASGFPKSLDVSKALDKQAGAEREVVGEYKTHDIRNAGMLDKKGALTVPITAPATDLAKQWQGWGTAAKPAFEPAVIAYKRQDTEHDIIIANLIKLEAQLWLMQFVCNVEWNSTSSPSELNEALSIAQWTAAELISIRGGLLGQMDMSQLSKAMITCLSIVQSWKRIWEEASELGSTFITATVVSPIIGWTTLKSSVSHLTLNFIIREWTQHDTEWLNVLSAASPFIVASKKLKSTLELIAVERAISRTSNPGLIDTKTTNEPAVLARKPLCGTVADNVTTWGVGALNIDGTRVGGDAGRWPANVIFDEEAAQILDAQSGERKSGGENGVRQRPNSNGWGMNAKTIINGRPADSGGASRFFYVAKASKAEREAGLDAPDGERANFHPTIKPLALMRYLVRLVTPKGGKVLDPFMGSGSTGCAAVLEGMDFVGIDITPEYVAIAQKRIAHYAVETPLEGLL